MLVCGPRGRGPGPDERAKKEEFMHGEKPGKKQSQMFGPAVPGVAGHIPGDRSPHGRWPPCNRTLHRPPVEKRCPRSSPGGHSARSTAHDAGSVHREAGEGGRGGGGMLMVATPHPARPGQGSFMGSGTPASNAPRCWLNVHRMAGGAGPAVALPSLGWVSLPAPSGVGGHVKPSGKQQPLPAHLLECCGS